MMLAIVPIVEGHSEVKSVPVLMRRILNRHGIYDVEIAKPIRVKRHQVVKEGELEKAIGLACLRPNCGAIVIILDADHDCPKELDLVYFAKDNRRRQTFLFRLFCPSLNLKPGSWAASNLYGESGVLQTRLTRYPIRKQSGVQRRS
jgi:hypothetical protein